MSRDIRSFFGGAPASSAPVTSSEKRKATKKAQTATKRTALTDASEVPITPPKKRPKTVKIEKKSAVIDLDSDINSDPEEPLSSAHRNKQKRIIISGIL